MFFLQMSRFPGSGKSTLARAIAPQLNAVIVNHDVTKTALLESMVDHPLDPALAGKAAFLHTLTIDANRPIEAYLTDVIRYIQQIDG
ncbi:ATP-binding protein [Exiguobacterium sp. S17]|nr:ATP-binding protein [Exiguobacterium sp. S17]